MKKVVIYVNNQDKVDEVARFCESEVNASFDCNVVVEDEDTLEHIRDLMFLDMDGDGNEFYNPTKDCDSDITGEVINVVMEHFGGYDEVFKDTPEEYREFE